jgi:hypothetical protein
MRTAHKVRLASILTVGAFGLHQLRYLIAVGGASTTEGHRYMSDLLPPIAVLVLAALLATLIRGTEGATPDRVPLSRRIGVFAGALLAIFVGQELLEGLMATGHPAGLAAVSLAAAGCRSAGRCDRTLAALLVRALEESSARSGDPADARGAHAHPPFAAAPFRPVDRASLLRLWHSAWHDGRLRRHLPRQVPIRVRFALV